MFLQTTDPKGQYLIYDIRAAELKKMNNGEYIIPHPNQLTQTIYKIVLPNSSKTILWIKTKLSDGVNKLYHLQYK